MSTLARLADELELEVRIQFVDESAGARARRRAEARSLALAGAAAGEVRRDFSRAKALARRNLVRMRSMVGDNVAVAWVDEWEALLASGPDAVCTALLDRSDHGHDLRQMSPFAGLLGEGVRTAVLDAVEAVP